MSQSFAQQFGQQIPLVIDANNIVRVGNCRLEGMKRLGWTTVLVVRTNLTGAELAAYAIADNRSGDPEVGSSFDHAALLDEGVRKRLLADAPLCVLISGGLDSSAILTLARKHKPDVVAYTATLDPASPDLLSARRLCRDLGVDLREVHVGQPTYADIRTAINSIEIPSKAQTEIALLCLPLAKRIAADGFKACLSGEAADELFAGYGNMQIAAAKADDSGYRQLRLDQLAKMARDNFVRTNKAFMAHGVEARLPFMETPLVELVLSLGKRDCPPGKKLLKQALRSIVPDWIIKRTKETFQGGSGMADAVARVVANPITFYNAECRTLFGGLTNA